MVELFIPVITFFAGYWLGKRRSNVIADHVLERFRLAFQKTPCLMAMQDPQSFRFLEANEMFLAEMGFNDEEIRGLDPVEIGLHDPASEMRQILLEAAESGESHREDLVWKTGQHEERRGRFSVIRIDVQKQSFLVCMAQDLTTLHTSRAELEKALETTRQLEHEARAATAAKSRFLANISHELRTPLNGIIGMLAVLKNQLQDPTHKRNVNMAAQCTEALKKVVNDVLDMSRLEEGVLHLNTAPLCPSRTLYQIHELFLPAAEAKNLDFHLELPHTDNREFVGDALRIRQILINLVGNAVEFTEEGFIRLSLKYSAKDQLTFLVEDSGVGMPPEQLEYLFRPFTQTDESIIREHQGTGLGLAIAKRLTQLMDGQLDAQTEPGQGTRLQLDLSLQPAS